MALASSCVATLEDEPAGPDFEPAPTEQLTQAARSWGPLSEAGARVDELLVTRSGASPSLLGGPELAFR